MSQQDKNIVDVIFKGVGLVLLGICSFFLVRFVNNSEATRESVIRLEVDFNAFKSRVEEQNQQMRLQVYELREEIKKIKR